MDINVTFESMVHYLQRLNKLSPISHVHMSPDDYESVLEEAEELWREDKLKICIKDSDRWFSIDNMTIYKGHE